MRRRFSPSGPSKIKERLGLYSSEYLGMIPETKVWTALYPISGDKNTRPFRAEAAEVWETLGDAVYNILYYRYLYQQGVPVNYYLYYVGRANVTMKCLMTRYLKDLIKINTNNAVGMKKTADSFEALIGMVFSQLISNDAIEITRTMMNWMNDIFHIEDEWGRMLYEHIFPCGTKGMVKGYNRDSYTYYEGAIIKLGIVYSAFEKYKRDEGAPTLIHDVVQRLYTEDITSYIPDIRETARYIIESHDPLLDIDLISDEIRSLV